MSEQGLPPWTRKRLVAEENGRRRRSEGSSAVVSPPARMHPSGLLEIAEHDGAMLDDPRILDSPELRSWRASKGADLVRLEGEIGASEGPIDRRPSRFESGHLSLRPIDTPELKINQLADGTIAVVVSG